MQSSPRPFILAGVMVAVITGAFLLSHLISGRSVGDLTATAVAQEPQTTYRGQLGAGSKKIKHQGDRTLVWARGDHSADDAEWFDFTGGSFPPEELQFGIGKDRIPAINDPLYVPADDPRLLRFNRSPYRQDYHAKTVDEILVFGYVAGDDVRAYPIGLLDHHEVVNDRIGGKPVAVGW